MTRPAAGDYAAQEDRAPVLGRASDAARGDLGRGRHDELKGVLDRLIGVEEEDILRAGAYVDREDTHRTIMIAPALRLPT